MEVCPSAMSLLFVILMGFSSSSHAYIFKVGGDDGWTLYPFENYGHWAERHRFKINDMLVFKYKKGNDSVLVVNKDDYLTCNKDNPIKTLKHGHSKFKFTKPGSFFFISGHEQNCEKGQKLVVVVLSAHHRNNTRNSPLPPLPEAPLRPPSSSPSPSPTTHALLVEPPCYSLPPSPGPKTPTQAPSTEPPSHYPTPSLSPKTSTDASAVEPPSPKTPTHVPPVEAPSHSSSPSPSFPKAEPPQHHHNAPTPGSHPTTSPPHHALAPAPAPSGAPAFGGSFALLVGICFATVMVSTGFV